MPNELPDGLKASVFTFIKDLSDRTGVVVDPNKVWKEFLKRIDDGTAVLPEEQAVPEEQAALPPGEPAGE